MSWDEAFAVCDEEWSAHMTEDVAFSTGLAGEADGPVVEPAVGTAGSRSRSRARPGAG
ncbi:hypothetical protein [Umezawaea tangerina]|uniref:hypothetical protein n=1 Tax=Umezawaea tangerina TaxID=84725 RepID=UPI0014727A3B|nr:hypothetical protein [Umezawaea tangerina]